ncbi:MAG: cytochrome b [Erythrobacter sp.]
MSIAEERYNRIAQMLHWVIAALVIANILTGLFHTAFEDVIRLVPIHKSVGMTIFALTIIRIAWRLTWTHPPYPATLSPFEVMTARLVQGVFYGLMLLMPLSGWIMASAGKYPLGWFGLFDVPKLAITQADPVYALGRGAHEILGWVFAALALLHIAAALRHRFILKDRVLQRMM